jgi:ribonuclease BN (tRNA processing enzyme)
MPHSETIVANAHARSLGIVRLTMIGCSGSFPGPGSPASCYLVEAEGFRLLVDLGSGALGVLQRYVDLYAIDAVCLSHLHGDHCLDMCGYAVARTYHPDGPRPRIPVYGPSQAAVRLARALTADPAAGDQPGSDPGHGMTDAFRFTTITPGTIQIGPLRVTAERMNHTVETFGFRLEHKGRSLAYSADTGETDALVRLARGADLLLCEASLVEPGARGPDLPQDLHLTGRQAGQHAARAGAGQLVLTHLAPWNDTGRSLEEADQAFDGSISLAASGLSIELE